MGLSIFRWIIDDHEVTSLQKIKENDPLFMAGRMFMRETRLPFVQSHSGHAMARLESREHSIIHRKMDSKYPIFWFLSLDNTSMAADEVDSGTGHTYSDQAFLWDVDVFIKV